MNLWIQLHTFAWTYPSSASAEHQQAARDWLAEFTRLVPSYGCRCKDKWNTLCELCPPPLESCETFYWWTVAIHDRVNQELGKPLAAPEWSLKHPAFKADLSL